MIEAGTYMIAALATHSDITLRGVKREHLSTPMELFSSTGAGFYLGVDSITPFGSLLEYTNICTAPYPAFPTDLQPQTAPLLALSCGGRITEGVWYGRFGYLSELSKFGLRYTLSSCGAEIYPSELRAAKVTAPDLRGGAALMIAALATNGESEVFGADIVGRGYENITKKLRGVGALIDEIN